MKGYALFLTLPLLLSCGAANRQAKTGHLEKKTPSVDVSARDLLRVGISYNTEGKSEKALEVLGKAVKKDAGLGAAYREMGLALSRLERLDEALAPLKKAVQLNPSDVDASLLLGMIYDLKHDSAKALEVYRTALQKRPNNPQLNHEYGLSLLMAGKPKEAVTVLEKAREYRDDAGLLGDLGYAYLLCGRSRNSVITLKESLRKDGSKPEVLFNLARACVAAEDNKCALEALVKLTRMVPDEPGPYYNLGLLLEKQGKKAEARKAMQHAVKLAPQFVPVVKWLSAHPDSKSKSQSQ